jgi:hypothetical protein
MKTAIMDFAGAGKTTVFKSFTELDADTGSGAKDTANLELALSAQAEGLLLWTSFSKQTLPRVSN